MSQKRCEVQKLATVQILAMVSGLRDHDLKPGDDAILQNVSEFIKAQSSLLEVYLAKDEKSEPTFDPLANGYTCGDCGEGVSIVDKYCRHCGKALDWG